MSQTITCPSCKTHIDLDQVADEKFSAKLHEQEKFLKQEAEKQRKGFEKEMEEKTIEMRKQAKDYAEKKANEERKKVELEMKDMSDRVEKMQEEQQKSKKTELEMIKRQRELEDKEKNFELEMEKKIELERKEIEKKVEERIRENSQKEFAEKMEQMQDNSRKKEQELLKKLEQTNKSLQDAQRRAEQGSQQIQGDISEDELRDSLRQSFPIDDISDVATGIKGADVIHTVKNNIGQHAGIIIWESKNTKNFDHKWILKLKDDKLKGRGDIAILVTTTLPKEIENFGMLDDVMICTPKFAIAVAGILRDKLISIAKTEKSLEGKDIKMELIYKYLGSEAFSGKINMIVDVFQKLKSGIDKERRLMEKNWKNREMDLLKADTAILGMYGELESLMGQALPGSEILELESGEE